MLLRSQGEQFVAAASMLTDLELLDPSRCRGWSRLDLVVHVRMGLEEMAMGCAALVDGPADADAASYWRGRPDDRDDDRVRHILWLRRTASAYATPSTAVTHLGSIMDGALNAVDAMPEGVVRFQQLRLQTGDFLATWVVEVAIHLLDLDVAGDPPVGLGWTRRTLEALAGAQLPQQLDDRAAVLAGLGRVPAPGNVRLEAEYPVALW